MSPLIDAFELSPEKGALQQVTQGVWWLKMPLPFDLDHINLYLLEEQDGWVIIDTGLGGHVSRDIWKAALAGPLAGKPFKQVIVTHYHPDHIGSAGWLCQHYQIPLLISQKEYDCAAQQLIQATSSEQQQAYLHALGVDQGAAAPVIKASAGVLHMYDPLPDSYQPLSHNQTLSIADRQWRVQLADGHSPAHATLYCAELNLLISGDQVLPRISSNVSVRMDSPDANPLACWLSSLEALKALPEETLVLPAHDAPFYGLHRRLVSLQQSHADLLEKLLGLLTDDCWQTVHALTHPLYKRKLHGFNLFLALGECQAHLHYLFEQGKVGYQQNEQGQHLYRRTRD